MIAVTGASGLLGQHIMQTLKGDNLEATGIYRTAPTQGQPQLMADLLDPVSLRETFEGIHTVVHAAAMVSFNPRWRNRILETNVTGTHNVVNACLDAGVKQLIYISSVAALGRVEGALTTEESPWTGTDLSDYAESKYLAELEVYRGVEEGLNASMVNPSVILSGMQPGRSSSAILDYVWKGNFFCPKGNLNYVDVRDVCEAVLRLLKNPQPGERFILSAGTISYPNFFLEVAKRLKQKAPSIPLNRRVGWLAGVAGEWAGYLLNHEPAVTRQTAAMASRAFSYSNLKAREKLQLPFHSLEDTLDWCCEDYLRNVKVNK